MNDPKDTFRKLLVDVGQFRGDITTELLRLPAPDPARKTLEDLDNRMAKAEREFRMRLGLSNYPLPEPRRQSWLSTHIQRFSFPSPPRRF